MALSSMVWQRGNSRLGRESEAARIDGDDNRSRCTFSCDFFDEFLCRMDLFPGGQQGCLPADIVPRRNCGLGWSSYLNGAESPIVLDSG